MADEKIPKKKKTIKKAVKPKKKKWAVDDPDKPLTVKQRIFVMRYIANYGNGTEAVKFAKFTIKNPAVYASELLIKPNIQKYYNEQFNKAFEETGFMVQKSMQNIAKMANSNISDFQDLDTGELKLKEDMPENMIPVIKEYEIKESIVEEPDGSQMTIHKQRKLKLYDSLKANKIILEMAGKFADKEGNRKTENIEDKMSEFISTLEKKELE